MCRGQCSQCSDAELVSASVHRYKEEAQGALQEVRDQLADAQEERHALERQARDQVNPHPCSLRGRPVIFAHGLREVLQQVACQVMTL